MRIEMLGPSGVGKTTLMDAVRSLWEDRFIFPEMIVELLSTTSDNDVSRIVNSFFNGKTSLDNCLSLALEGISKTHMGFEQKFAAIDLLRESLIQYALSEINNTNETFLLHDELLLHRGFSFLSLADDFEDLAERYYRSVPAPDVAVIARAQTEIILERARQKQTTNCYKGLHDEDMKLVVLKSIALCAIAGETLAKRGVAVRFIDTSGTLEESSAQLNDILCECLIGKAGGSGRSEAGDCLKARTLESSKSFRKKTGRHYPMTPDVAYCAFTTPNFTVHRHEAQRDASERFARFGIDEKTLRGKRVLDLGANLGAMLFQASNFSIAEGLGIEFDYDKVKTAREIAALSHLDNVSFRQGDIDTLLAEELGVFDITFALAIEGHVRTPERLYRLLGDVTGEVLYFEGNGGCSIDTVKDALHKAGFRNVEYLGFCTDDIVPRNNRRPLLNAVK